MAAMFSNTNQPLSSSCFPNQSLASLISPFSEEHQTLISQQNTKKPRLASWGCGDGSFNKIGDSRFNPNQSLASSIPPLSEEHQTLISQQITKKPRLEAPWWSVDKSLDQLSVIFNKPPPITSTSTAGVSKAAPITSNSSAGVSNPPPITFNSTAGVLKPPPITLNSSAGVSDVVVIDDDEIDEEIPELSDILFDFTPPISPLSSVVSKPPPEVIVIDDEEEEEEIEAISSDKTLKLDSNGKESSTLVIDNDNEKKNNNGGSGEFGRVTVYDLGVTIEDLKRIPLEAFDPSLGIKSVMLDPSFGWVCSTDY